MQNDHTAMAVPTTTVQRWAELALQIRSYDRLLQKLASPAPNSQFALVERAYDRESVSAWSREGLRSAMDHLAVWADHAVPLQQFEGQVIQSSGFRWYFTLMRAAIEGAAQSAWLSTAASPDAAVSRLIRLVRHDVEEQRRAWTAMGREARPLSKRLERLERDAEASAGAEARKALPPMLSIVRTAAQALETEPDLYEGHWRTCSAAAHGKDWAIIELQHFTGDVIEWRPGQFLRAGHADVERLTSMLSDTLDLVARAMIRFTQRSTAEDITPLLKRSMAEAALRTPQRDGGTHVRKAAADLGVELP